MHVLISYNYAVVVTGKFQKRLSTDEENK